MGCKTISEMEHYTMSSVDITCNTWADFEKHAIENPLENRNSREQTLMSSSLLYRGHADANWKLETTLERFDKKYKYTEIEYHKTVQRTLPFVSSLTSRNFSATLYKKCELGPPPSYELMIYLRHHGFPSPLLDWSRSPYVAAYFAFERANENGKVAIFSFREYPKEGKTSAPSNPTIYGYNIPVITHSRHYLQQCEYTACYKEESRKRIYCCHEDVRFSKYQDLLHKYTLPASLRREVLEKLDLMNINAFSLFGNEEGLATTLAFRLLK